MSIAYTGEVSTPGEHEELAGRGINWWGMAFFIASEALIFANLIAAYLYLEIRNGNWQLPTELWFPVVNTFILLGSSFPAHFAGTNAAKGNMRNVKIGFLATIIMGAIFLSGQIYEYSGLFGKNFTPQATVFGSSFFTLTGFHGVHVTVGLIFLLIV